jgi:hypothetical protein
VKNLSGVNVKSPVSSVPQLPASGGVHQRPRNSSGVDAISPVSPVSQPPAAGGVHQRARRVKNSSGVRREKEREREGKRRGKREENERGICIVVTSFLK